MIKYSFLYLFYAKVYPFNQNMLPTLAYYAAIINKALIYLNNFSMQHDRLMLTLGNGFGELMAISIVDNLQQSVQQDMEEDLREEIYD